MKLASFQVQTPVGRFTRIGHVQQDNTLIDLSSAYAALRSHEGEPQPYRLAEALVPPDMKRFIEAGSTALKEAQRAVSYVLEERPGEGPQGETLVLPCPTLSCFLPCPIPTL